MKLSEERVNKVYDFLEEESIGDNCDLCGDGSLHLSPNVFEFEAYSPGGLAFERITDTVYPIAVFTCEQCGNTVILNAIKVGIVEHRSGLLGGSDPDDTAYRCTNGKRETEKKMMTKEDGGIVQRR